MGISVLNPAAAASSINAKSCIVTGAYTTNKIVDTFGVGTYTVSTSPNDKQVWARFSDSSGTIIADVTTVSGTISATLTSAASVVYITDTSASTSTTVTITLVATNSSSSALSGTLDTITNTSTYNSTGLLYVLAIGGGGGGSGGSTYNGRSGGGGGGASANFVYTNTATSVTIGSQGNAGVTADQFVPGNAGGTTSFGNLITVNGGAGGIESSSGAASGTPGNANGGMEGSTAEENTVRVSSLAVGTNGGGGGGGRNGNGGDGRGSGIGTGGRGGGANNSSTVATGYGAGGGGGAGIYGTNQLSNKYPTNGTQGIMYIRRGF